MSNDTAPIPTSDSPEAVRASPRPIFIGGHHRSGTTLMRVLLNRHPAIACGPESQLLERTSFLAFHRFLEETYLPQLRQYGLAPAEIDRGVAAFINNFLMRYAARRGKPRWAEKTPKNIVRITYLFRLFPDAQFVHMVRDPRDVYCSVREKARTSAPHWSSDTPKKVAHSWVQFVESGLAWRSHSTRYLEVRYEDLACDPETAMRGVLTFLGEPWHDSVLEPNDQLATDSPLTNVNRAVFTTSVGRWRRELKAEDVYVIEAIAGACMRDLGYTPALDRATG